MQIETVLIPFGQLTKSPFNVRTQRDEATVKTLAASIRSHGLLHNLVVHELGAGRKGSRKTAYGVADGERRRCALDLLIAEKHFRAGYQVPCRVITVDEAAAMSLAANLEREAMHPADELAGFRTLQEAGKSAEEIAASYGVTPLVVRRRLKLANVAPQFLEMFRRDELGLDVMMALAQTDDHDRQARVWDALPQYQRSAHRVRDALTSDEVDVQRDRIARYVGSKAYEAAGGVIRRDLFSDETNGGYMQDAALLHQLGQAKLGRKEREVAKEGWSWTETRLTFDHSERSTFGRVRTVRRDPTEEEQARLSAITARLEVLASAGDAEDGDDLADKEQNELWELEEERNELEDSFRVPDPEGKTYSGAVITIDTSGQAEVVRGLVRSEDRKRIEREQAQVSASKAQDSKANDGDAPEKEFSEKLTRNLTAQFTAALRVGVARSPAVAVAAIVYPLVMDIFDAGKSWERYVVGVNYTKAYLDSDAPGIEDEKAMRAWEALYEQWRVRVPKTHVLSWLLEQPLNELLELLALCTSATIDCRDRRALPDDAKILGRAVKLTMSEWWEATAASFLSHVPKTVIVQAVSEAGKVEEAKTLGTEKKADAVTAAEELLRGSGWLPSVMRLG